MVPKDAARLDKVRMLTLTDVDPAACTGTLRFMPWDDNQRSSVRINLVNGELVALSPEFSKSEKNESAVSCLGDDELASPSGRFILEYIDGPSPRMTIKNAEGDELDVISRVRGLSNAVWSPSEEHFAFLADTGNGAERNAGLFVYSMKQRRHEPVARGITLAPEWSADGRLLICLETQTGASKGLRERVRETRGTITVLDAHSGFKPVLTAGKLAGYTTLSPRSTKIAFTELLQDEYGDFDTRSLRVAHIGTHGIVELLRNRREPLYIWAGDNTVAATTYDKYAVPTLSLVSLPDGTERQLVTARDFAGLEPLAYLPGQKRIIYKAAERLSDIEAEELWAVEAGRQPVRLFPQAGRGRS